jgi:hypothetical protein
MDRCDFEIVERTSLFVLLNEPLDTRNLLYKWLWYGAGRLISSSDRLGAVAGRRLSRLAVKLASRRKESPTTELMVCRRLSSGPAAGGCSARQRRTRPPP